MNEDIFFKSKDKGQGWNCTRAPNQEAWLIGGSINYFLGYHSVSGLRIGKPADSLGSTVKYLLSGDGSVVWRRGSGFDSDTDLGWGHCFQEALGPAQFLFFLRMKELAEAPSLLRNA